MLNFDDFSVEEMLQEIASLEMLFLDGNNEEVHLVDNVLSGTSFPEIFAH